MNYRIKRLFTYVVILGLLGCKLGENSNSYTGFPDIISLSAVERDLALLLGNPNEVLILGNEYVIKDNKSDFILHFFNRNDHGHLGSFVRKGNGPSEETMIQALAHVDDNSLIYKTLEGLTRIAYDISSNKVELIETWDVPMDFLTVAYPFDSSKVLGWNYSMHPGEFLLYNPLTEIFTDFGDGFSFREQKLSIEESHRIFGNKQITVKPGNRYFAASYMAIPIVRIFDAQTGEIVKELTTKQNYDFVVPQFVSRLQFVCKITEKTKTKLSSQKKIFAKRIFLKP